jgi:hypothetical protein
VVTHVRHDEGGVKFSFITVLRVLRGIISKEKLRRSRMTANPLFELRSRYNALLFPCALSHAQTVNR